MKTLNNYQINMGSQFSLDSHCELLDERKLFCNESKCFFDLQ